MTVNKEAVSSAPLSRHEYAQRGITATVALPEFDVS
jgi:hypothetical protein